jgi:hypothetical protein
LTPKGAVKSGLSKKQMNFAERFEDLDIWKESRRLADLTAPK